MRWVAKGSKKMTEDKKHKMKWSIILEQCYSFFSNTLRLVEKEQLRKRGVEAWRKTGKWGKSQ